MRVSGGQTRGIVSEGRVARDKDGESTGQDLTLGGHAGDRFSLQVGGYGSASALITLADDGAGNVDFQTTAQAISSGSPMVPSLFMAFLLCFRS